MMKSYERKRPMEFADLEQKRMINNTDMKGLLRKKNYQTNSGARQ